MRPSRPTRPAGAVPRELVGASHLTRIGRTRTRRVRGGVTPCPALESVALSDSGNLGVGALVWVTSMSQLLADFVGAGFREGMPSVVFKDV
ncbi:unnamed protein product [Rangifer tarandus platyrhynchus]|uniref:Uncharacterized protein n=2 Tax=Rangifer tarandus platyrhynchus TaxID=3082113 RepID=A0ACB0EIP9_RANTA|nr:unnamed protein product [Rangifer tarandus platyrhynchus]CAI9700051.1 unnamed protein product [Rangifer tarandus platyrhynchus]